MIQKPKECNLGMHRLAIASCLIFATSSIAGCSSTILQWQFRSAESMASVGQAREALVMFDRIVIKAPESPLALLAARKGVQLATYELRDFAAAEKLLKWLILSSPNSEERLDAQRDLADLYSEKMFDYEKAVVELERVIKLIPESRRGPYQLMLARAHANLNDVSQALLEIESVLIGTKESRILFDANLFKANLLQTAKRFDEAVATYRKILKAWPEFSREESVALNFAVCLEEQGNLKQAIEVLEIAKKDLPMPQFVETRISAIKERMENQPGAGGFKR